MTDRADLAERLARLEFLEFMRDIRNAAHSLRLAPAEKLLLLELLGQAEEAGSLTIEYRGPDVAQKLAISSRTLARCHQSLKARKIIFIEHEGQNSRKRAHIYTDTGPLY